MPFKPKKCCSASGCPNLADRQYCDDHQHLVQTHDQGRGSAAKRGYGRKWQEARLAYLKLHPLCECEECKVSGRPEPSEVVDHVTPHRGDQKLFWNRNNWRAMSKRHHDAKTAREDGGLGNRAQR